MHSLSGYYNFNLTPEQENALDSILEFLQSEQRVFVLKGHAGTGKTSLILGIIRYLETKATPCCLLASTGRAAKVLADKTHTNTRTVHRQIYKLVTDTLKMAESETDFQLTFTLSTVMPDDKTVFFVDESSMIADSETMNMHLLFGQGRLLTDLITFTNNCKIIFIGDPAQLPPVNYIESPALNPGYFSKHLRIEANCFKLSNVMRFKSDTGISNVTRDLQRRITDKVFPYLNLKVSGFTDIKVCASPEALADEYVKLVKCFGTYSVIGICLSNKMAATLNFRIRTGLFPKLQLQLNRGELLMVVQNNYALSLANGEHVEVQEVSDRIETRAGVSFRDVSVVYSDSRGASVLQCKIIDNLLFSSETNLDWNLEKALMRDFIIRMANESIKPKDPQFFENMIKDPYLNALRVKFGYAITCHKAQGGEWKHVMVVLEPALFMQSPEVLYRWVYTAVSRATEKLWITRNRCLY